MRLQIESTERSIVDSLSLALLYEQEATRLLLDPMSDPAERRGQAASNFQEARRFLSRLASSSSFPSDPMLRFGLNAADPAMMTAFRLGVASLVSGVDERASIRRLLTLVRPKPANAAAMAFLSSARLMNDRPPVALSYSAVSDPESDFLEQITGMVRATALSDVRHGTAEMKLAHRRALTAAASHPSSSDVTHFANLFLAGCLELSFVDSRPVARPSNEHGRVIARV
jgi:hypothetical protein